MTIRKPQGWGCHKAWPALLLCAWPCGACPAAVCLALRGHVLACCRALRVVCWPALLLCAWPCGIVYWPAAGPCGVCPAAVCLALRGRLHSKCPGPGIEGWQSWSRGPGKEGWRSWSRGPGTEGWQSWGAQASGARRLVWWAVCVPAMGKEGLSQKCVAHGFWASPAAAAW